MKYLRILLMSLIAIPAISYGIGSSFPPIRVVEGSSLLSVRSICRDDRGMIWFGTDMNLYKYDGYECIKCLDSQDKANGRLFINCLECFGDSILLGCVDGIAFYDRLNETFTPILYLKDVEVYSLLKDDEGIWIGAQSGLYRYSFDGGVFSAVAGNSSTDSEWIRSMAFSGNYIYIGTTAHLARYGLASGIYEQLQVSGLPSDIGGIDAIVPQSGGHLLIGTSDGLYDVDLQSNTSSLLASYEWVKTMKETGDRLVLGTDAGLFLYDRRDGSNNMISGNVVWSIMNDSAGNCWYGSDTGLLMSRKEIIRPVDGLPEGALNCYSNISGDNMGRIFAGGTHGLVILDAEDSCDWYRLGDSGYSLSHNKVRSISHDPVSDNVYVLLPTGLSFFNIETKVFENKRFNYFTTFYDGYGMVADTSEMWVAALSGVYKVEEMRTVRQYTNADGLSSSRAVQVERTADGHIWVRTTDRSIFLFDRESDVFVPFADPAGGDNMKGDLMMADSKGNIWITQGAEVCRVCMEDGEWTSERYDFGKTSSFEIKTMVEVDNEIWICLPNEITIVNPDEGSIGRLSMDCDYAGMYYDKSGGRVLLGATDRIDEVFPDDIRAILRNKSAAIHVTGVVVNEETVLPYSVIKTGQVTLSHRENCIRLSFSDFDYSIGNMRRFMFNLDGRENQWIETRGNSIMLPDLPPGRHRIFISSSGSEQTNTPVFTVKILRPWYLSWWALALYSLVFLSITFLIAKNTILRNKLEMEREQKQRLLAQATTKMNFFTEVAHEFKTPLSLIMAPIGKLLQETEDQGRRKTLQLMQNNAMKLNSLIRLSLDYYNDRSEPGEEVIQLNVEFVEFAKSIFNSFKESWPDHTFIFNSSSPSIEAVTDVIKMETILNNLLSNACKYTPADGTVILALEENAEKGTLQISVSDTGIGIPDEELPFIYQRYFQSSRSKKQRKDGSGVGLTIVRKYVEQLKGEITVSSDDNGTTFRLSFPVRPDLPDNAGEPEVVLTKENKPLVVIVDDNRSICDFLTDALSPEFQCVCAFDGNSGLKLCRSVSPDLIISDVVMPVMDGLEMCRQIRKNNSLSTVPIILLTARGDHETELKSIDLNIDMFIPKPFDMQTLYSRVKQLAGRRKTLEKKVRIDMIAEPKAEIGQSVDEKYLLKVTSLIENHIDDPELSVTKLCELGGFSEKQLYRKIKSLTGMTTVEYIRSIRMKKAAMLLQSCKFTVSEAMYMVGFSNTSYFARTFSEMYGKSPSEYQQSFRG
ncbi:MAG: response regulator [Bacteroidaceae bacterium]|nr:response regulator [Bacteroidaceae bacterium]